MRQALIIRQVDRLLLGRRQTGDRSSDGHPKLLVGLSFERTGSQISCAPGSMVVQRSRYLLPARRPGPQAVDGAAARQCDQPRHRRATPDIVTSDFSPDLQIHILKQLIRFFSAAENPQAQGIEQRAGVIIELAERLLISCGDPRKQVRIDRRGGASSGCIHTECDRASRPEMESPHVRNHYSIYEKNRQKDLHLTIEEH